MCQNIVHNGKEKTENIHGTTFCAGYEENELVVEKKRTSGDSRDIYVV